MRNLCRLAVVLAGAMASIVPQVEAVSLRVGAPEEVAAGWTRISGRYESAGVVPVFRATAFCGDGPADVHVLDGRVYLAPADGAVWIDLPGTPDRLVPAGTPCEAPEVSIEMLVDATVVASAPVSQRRTVSDGAAVLLATPAEPARPVRRFSLKGQKYAAPFSKRTEAGVEWSIDSHVSIQLNYERTAQAPTMSFDHDDGILTRFRIGF
jgi:hypothetical protein